MPLSNEIYNFIGGYLELKHHLLINSSWATLNMMIDEPDKLIIREIESEEELCSM
jgi:hypothetical protein